VRIRLLADADLNFAIVTGARLREPAIDFLSAAEGRLRGVGDPEVLRIAAGQGRILVSHDRSTIPVHFARMIGEGMSSPGVFLASQDAPVGDVINALILIWSASLAVDWEDQITHLPSLARHLFPK
jgi:hypothetical protein